MVSSSNSKQLFHANVYENGQSLPLSAACEPLMDARQRQPASNMTSQDQDATFNRFKLSALAIGLLVGVIVQFSTLGANFLVLHKWNIDLFAQSSQEQVIVFSLLWSFITSAAAIIILAFLRNLVNTSYLSKLNKAQDVLDEMMLQLECRFVVGALVGVCVAWSITDAIMGLQKEIILSLGILAVALAWCRFIMSYLGNSSDNHTAAPATSAAVTSATRSQQGTSGSYRSPSIRAIEIPIV